MKIINRSMLTLMVSGFSALLFFASGSIYAQDTEESSDVGGSLFDEITVTARRREETLYETPAAVTAMDRGVIDSLNISNLDDGSIPAEQVSALAMAVYLNSMSA